MILGVPRSHCPQVVSVVTPPAAKQRHIGKSHAESCNYVCVSINRNCQATCLAQRDAPSGEMVVFGQGCISLQVAAILFLVDGTSLCGPSHYDLERMQQLSRTPRICTRTLVPSCEVFAISFEFPQVRAGPAGRVVSTASTSTETRYATFNSYDVDAHVSRPT